MTGGAGFFDGIPIKPVERTTINWEKSGETQTYILRVKNDPNYRSQADSEALNEAIAHRFQTKKELQRITGYRPRDSISRSGPFYFMTIRKFAPVRQKATYYVVYIAMPVLQSSVMPFLDLAGRASTWRRASTCGGLPPDKQGK